ncbi:hypothetical protein SAMN00017405_0836 [Desulfonispora thiosulfatigenes DSM 11270]|uniref:Uncharacterized protein n=1 Tax=Desulfonispora thiosulfatigenes DSM 11270 TaxID=656914 RepID=A0A1W1UGD3_DESTI|nr:hypothetical protein [Desulfonispora thiosulfatigenes]SMB80099.1 hypothetical protein SAMN00017405_0836 [Desulfonispora thiosulfatigenes DSM 11270]
MYDLNKFYENLTTILSRPIDFTCENVYLDLATFTNYKVNLILEKINIPPLENPLIDATFLIVNSMKSCHLTQTKLGINELLKSFLLHITPDNQEKCAECYSDFLYEIFLNSLQDTYPYTDLLWTYFGDCFHTVALILVENGYIEGSDIFLKKIALMGKIAAQKGLHTSNIQHFLHTLEVRAYELKFDDLANSAKNYRFNLEN